MKRTIKIALLLCLIVLVSVLTLTACDITDILGKNPQESTSETTTSDETTPEETPQHIWSEWIVIKEVTCEEKGLLQRYCTECNYTESKPIDALGHTEVIVQAVAPTCTQNGWTEGKYCSTCNEVFVAQTTIDVLGHSYTSTVTPPTVTEDGYKLTYTCSNCNDTYTEAIVPTDFTVTKENRAMIGFTGEANENLIIPAVFQHNGTWYRVTTIGNFAFEDCSKLTSVTIGDSVTTIGGWAFSNCSNLTEITIPDSVTTIGNWAFYYCYNLTEITIPDSVTTIGNWAFYYCYNLTEITIPDSVTTIGDMAFYHCSNLTSIVVDGNNPAYQSINGNLYSKDGTVLIAYAIGKTDTSFTIPDSVTTIGNSAFYRCDNLTSVTIGNSVTTIGGGAFAYCYNLTSITIPDSVTTIGNSAFFDCYKLVEVINKSSLTITAGSEDNGYVADYAKEVHNGTTKIVNQNNYLFYTYNGVNYLLGYVGTDTALTLPENYNGQNYEIYQRAFQYCYNLTSVTIPDSVTTIGDGAFSNCSNLTSITFEGTVAQWNAISKGSYWTYKVPATKVVCSNGTVRLY